MLRLYYASVSGAGYQPWCHVTRATFPYLGRVDGAKIPSVFILSIVLRYSSRLDRDTNWVAYVDSVV